ncbi:hypothetical protein ACFPME_09880 [Rhodanobacter umsongensis]|uniref:Uncharacterized protein n=1 Tax=Rhodanobacter umsongensis TaxID=633153 RepID=A0ABW0JLH2_9GAMM
MNSIGLCMDIAGALSIWKFGLPEQISREGHQFIVIEEKDGAEAAKAKRYDKFARVGISLLVLGFLLQLVSDFI